MSQATGSTSGSSVSSNCFDTECGEPWPQSEVIPQILPREIHIWSASLDISRERVEYYERCLDGREIRRASRYSIELSRKRFICARGILKELLGKYADTDPEAISFSLGPLGKPYLPAEFSPDLQFNSTDTKDEALFAVCRSAEIGIDIELESRKVRHQEIALRKFSCQELEQYHQCPKSQQKKFFLKIWTRKEAYGKAKGVGIRYRLNSVNLVDDMDSDRFAVHDDDGKIWEIIQISPAPGVIACVIVEGTGWRFRCLRVSDV